MKPFFGRLGNKERLLKEIIPLIPSHKIYVEAFVGGGAVFWNKEKVEVNVLNDLDNELIEGYKLLKEAPPVEELLSIAVRQKETQKEARSNKEIMKKQIERIRLFMRKEEEDKAHRLLKRLYHSKNTYSNVSKGLIYKENTHIRLINKTLKYKEKLQEVILTSKDYKEVIKEYDSENTFIYLDPPYEEGKYYKNYIIDLEELRDILRGIRGKFMLSLNMSDNVKDIFDEFKMKEVLSVRRNMGGTSIGKTRKEYIIMNY